MELRRNETIKGMLDEYAGFADLLDSLSEADWTTPTRCAGFEVRDVAGHVVGLCEDTAAGVPGSRTAEEEAASVRGDTPRRAADRLRAALEPVQALGVALDDDAMWIAPSGAPDLTMGEGVLTLWYDTFVHADDIRHALGRPPEPGPGLVGALAYLEWELARRSWGPARVELRAPHEELGPLVVGAPGAGTSHEVAAHEFVLVATGRVEPGPLGFDDAVNIYAP